MILSALIFGGAFFLWSVIFTCLLDYKDGDGAFIFAFLTMGLIVGACFWHDSQIGLAPTVNFTISTEVLGAE